MGDGGWNGGGGRGRNVLRRSGASRLCRRQSAGCRGPTGTTYWWMALHSGLEWSFRSSGGSTTTAGGRWYRCYDSWIDRLCRIGRLYRILVIVMLRFVIWSRTAFYASIKVRASVAVVIVVVFGGRGCDGVRWHYHRSIRSSVLRGRTIP